jgi:hypothetical protein
MPNKLNGWQYIEPDAEPELTSTQKFYYDEVVAAARKIIKIQFSDQNLTKVQERPSYMISRDRLDGAVGQLKQALAVTYQENAIQTLVEAAIAEAKPERSA